MSTSLWKQRAVIGILSWVNSLWEAFFTTAFISVSVYVITISIVSATDKLLWVPLLVSYSWIPLAVIALAMFIGTVLIFEQYWHQKLNDYRAILVNKFYIAQQELQRKEAEEHQQLEAMKKELVAAGIEPDMKQIMQELEDFIHHKNELRIK